MDDEDQPTTVLTPSGGDESPGVGRLAVTVARLREQVRRGQAAADGRALVEMAKGVLVERLGCGPAHAARQLTELAGKAGVSRLELAADLVNQAAQDRFTGAVDESCGDAVLRLRTAESGALAATDTQRVAESLLAHALAPLGASAVVVWSVAPDSALSLVAAAGLPPQEARRWHYVPPGVNTPARHALLARIAVWIEDLAASGLPSVAQRALPGGRVAAPAGIGGRIVGVLEICWPQPLLPQPLPVQRQVEALAELCARTLEAGTSGLDGAGAPRQEDAGLIDVAEGLLDPAMVLRPHRDAGGRLVDFHIHHANSNFADLSGRPRTSVAGTLLLENYPMAAADGQLYDKIERVYATGEPFRAERMTLTTLVEQVPLTVVASVGISRHGDAVLLVWRVHDEATRLAGLLQHAQRLGRIGGFEENRVSGEVTWNSQLFAHFGLARSADPLPLSGLADHAHPDDAPAINGFLRTLLDHRRSATTGFRLRRPDGITRHIRVIAEPVLDSDGELIAVRGAYQDVSAQHWTEVALSATRDQLAQTEQQAAEQNRLARQLQQAIMPPTQPAIEASGLRIAAHYRPAEQDHLVGGDWYDAVVLPSKQVMVSVGDITGHGVDSATGMVVLRNALRGLATTGASPAQLLTWLNLVTHQLTDSLLATAVCGLYDPETRVLRWARAGHLPPVLIRDDRATALPMLQGTLLGALDDAQYEIGEVQMEKGDILLLYTDGLVERRDRHIDDCVDHLLATAAGSGKPLEELIEHLLRNSGSDGDDDTCIVGIQLW